MGISRNMAFSSIMIIMLLWKKSAESKSGSGWIGLSKMDGSRSASFLIIPFQTGSFRAGITQAHSMNDEQRSMQNTLRMLEEISQSQDCLWLRSLEAALLGM